MPGDIILALLTLAVVALAVAVTLLAVKRRECRRLQGDMAALRRDLGAAQSAAAMARHESALAQRQTADWERTKQETITAAKAAALASTAEMSSKLLADHKREAEAARKDTTERVKQTTETLFRRFEHVTKAVASLNDQVTQNKDVVDTVWRALSSPGGAGYFAEIGLENTLTSFGLQPGRDFVMQHSVATAEGGRLRPDAVVFLPGDSVLVVDSKASKFLLELAQADEQGEIEATYANLAASMNRHLRELAAKDYRAAIIATARQAGRADALGRVLSIMYLPNEGALEKLSLADPTFAQKAAKAEIIPAGPAGLACLIGFARVEIDLGRQSANRERIVEATQGLLEAIAVMLGHVDTVGKGVKRSADGFASLTASINRTLLPRARTIAGLGVRSGKRLPDALPGYQVVAIEDTTLIEGEATPPAPPQLVPPSDDTDTPAHNRRKRGAARG